MMNHPPLCFCRQYLRVFTNRKCTYHLRTHFNNTSIPPDLITSDINIPGLDGDALLHIICACKPHILVLVISENIHPNIQKKCIYRGASSFIAKPFAMNDSD